MRPETCCFVGIIRKLDADAGIEMRTSNINAQAHVSRSIFRFDREALVCEHIADRIGHGSLTFQLRKMQDGGPYDQYSAHLDHLWDGAQPGEPDK